ncbi:hypothetical protein [Streptomyces sp. Ru87]|uniref:hypothetical protein n=1 Tax=Streptomyces sp. Ru87 TaxID=2044307 RepID=UPI000BF2A7A2|nr:hypothetical protein [Streptomyces sp. Ru87]PGH51698.1 hypothetical protein CRI70_05240 [Streptomyces sp. Ru87]
MWPGQQPPGGEQNPQDPNANPYAQPGNPQPNPYQQPQYQQPGYAPGGQPPNPYQQPTSQWAAPGMPGAPQPPDEGRKTKITAIVAALAVVIAAGVTGFLVLGGDDDEKTKADKKPAASKSATAEPSAEETGDSGADVDNPRGGAPEVGPVIDGWQTVINQKRKNAFDVPESWTVESPGMSIGFEDTHSEEEIPPAVVMMSAPAFYEEEWCTSTSEGGYESSTALAAVGTKGAQGAKSLDNAAEVAAETWAYAAFDQDETGTRKVSKAKPFKSDHGISGSVSSATVTGVKKKDKCASDGKTFTVAYKDSKGDYAVWCLYAATGVEDEVADATIKKIMSSLRPLKSS